MCFRASGDELPFDSLSEVFADREFHICKKGDSFQDRIRNTTMTFDEDVFSFDKRYDTAITEDTVINEFITELLPHKGYIRSLSRNHLAMFWLSIYPDGYHTNIKISYETMTKLCEFGIELNVEISILQDFYEGRTKWLSGEK